MLAFLKSGAYPRKIFTNQMLTRKINISTKIAVYILRYVKNVPSDRQVTPTRSAENGACALSPPIFGTLTVDETERWAKWSRSQAPNQNDGANRPGRHHRAIRSDLLPFVQCGVSLS
jgi:hypothetical protein